MYNFVAIDFETANYYRNSACSVGIVKVENNHIAKQECRLIKPPSDWFMFTDVHGLSWKDVENEPDFKEVWLDINHLLEGADFIAAHNAPFDRSVLNKCCKYYDISPPENRFICTMKLARKHLCLHSTALANVCDYFNIELDHHEALSDARACAKILIEMIKLGARI